MHRLVSWFKERSTASIGKSGFSKWVTAAAVVFLTSIIVGLLVMGLSWLFAPSETEGGEEEFSEAETERILAERVATPDAENPLILWQDVDYSEGEGAAWYPKGESPLLAEMVDSGELLPVEERVGPEPLVLKGVEGIGNYGGVWVEANWSVSRFAQIDQSYSYANLVRWSPEGYPVVPHIAKGWDVNEEKTEYTFHLRKGMRWSDGHPFTADDIVYYYQAELLDPVMGGGVYNSLAHVGEIGRVEKVDDYTVRFVFSSPNGIFLEMLAGVAGRHLVNSPKHYLEPLHPTKGDPEKIEKAREELAMPSAYAMYERVKRFDNPQHPRLWPWVQRTDQTTPPYGYIRNPYFFAVDAEGNQLPYFDRLHRELKSLELLTAASAAGELNLQMAGLRFDSYTLLMGQREKQGYSVRHWYPSVRSALLISPNINRKVFKGNTESMWKNKLLTDKRFRQALSLSLDRQAIIDTAFLGFGVPSQIEPGPGSPFHHSRLANSFIEFDPDRASALLDEIGLVKRDSEGMRTYPDGTRMEFYILTTTALDAGAVQMVADDWMSVGVRSKLRVRSQRLMRAEIDGLIHDFAVGEGFAEFIPTRNPRSFLPYGGWCDFAPGFARWYMAGGLLGDPKADELETPGPDEGTPIRRSMELYDEVRQAPTLEKQVELFSKILDIAAENVWSINIATPPPYLVLVKDGVHNVPEFAVGGNDMRTPGSSGMETYYLDDTTVAQGTMDHMRNELRSTPGLPGSKAVVSAGSNSNVKSLLMTLMVIAAVLGLISLALRHPFVGRRLVLMVPTLGVISILTFVIIQLPPGDFLTTLTIQLQEQGGEASERQLEEFSELFHLDESSVEQYLRWSGLHWFSTFESHDRGLLQGDLGLSMDTRQPVNQVVGDRIMLTVLISMGTILITWSLAIPIGIYSAVRQYSPGDYFVSFIGFLGMSIPNFLLAILLMYFSSEYFGLPVSGLFSAEYAVQPDWSFGKVLDLLQHIWIPVLVLAVGGTAGMVRVMRGNLLDELRKPYVTTARAKGMRHWRIILKYPVRLALNPFISGIGTLFPQLISGGAITAVILSLPTVGPLMLEAFRNEDMYLAGSLLMVLSFLGIFGTLVSDLLLLVLDPRIRMDSGGSK